MARRHNLISLADVHSLDQDHIVPRLVPELEIIPWRPGHVLAIQVYPG